MIPVAILGSDDQAPILYDVKPLARRLGLPVAPITPTFPWFGPLGLVPYPVRYRIVYGEPIDFASRTGPRRAATTAWWASSPGACGARSSASSTAIAR